MKAIKSEVAAVYETGRKVGMPDLKPCPCGRTPEHLVGVAEAWQEGYRQGVLDERTSEANIGIAGFGAKVEPARNNPYALAQQPTPPSAPVGVDGLVAGCRVLLEQYEASGDFTMGGKLTNKPFLMIRAALNELFGNSEQLPVVNDEMVERACIAMGHELSPADRWPQDYGREVPDLRRGMRAALTAALAAQSGDSDNDH